MNDGELWRPFSWRVAVGYATEGAVVWVAGVGVF
jgi:hypothetical protein